MSERKLAEPGFELTTLYSQQPASLPTELPGLSILFVTNRFPFTEHFLHCLKIGRVYTCIYDEIRMLVVNPFPQADACWRICSWRLWKHCGKRRKCWASSLFLFDAMFLTLVNKYTFINIYWLVYYIPISWCRGAAVTIDYFGKVYNYKRGKRVVLS